MLKCSTIFFSFFLNFLRRGKKMLYLKCLTARLGFLMAAQQNGLISNFKSELRSVVLCRLIEADQHF